MEYTYIVMFKQSKVSGVQIKKSKICQRLAFSVFFSSFKGFAAVHLSVREGHMTCLRHLVTADADVNVPDGKSGYTALHHATDCENLGIVGYLLLEVSPLIQ